MTEQLPSGPRQVDERRRGETGAATDLVDEVALDHAELVDDTDDVERVVMRRPWLRPCRGEPGDAPGGPGWWT